MRKTAPKKPKAFVQCSVSKQFLQHASTIVKRANKNFKLHALEKITVQVVLFRMN